MSRPASLLILVIATSTMAASAPRSSTPQGYNDRYGVLSERNIFVRDRSHPSSRPAATQASSPRDPERSLWLVGVVVEGDGLRAYVENQNVGTILKLGVGDTLARGKISAIEIDAVAYESNGQTTWIEIGNDFANRPVTSLAESSSISVGSSSAGGSSPTTSPTTGPAGANAVNLNDPNLTPEQKMKLRRMQELKGR